MNVMMVGGCKGSWEVRGKQLGAAIGARCVAKPSVADWTWAEVVVLVKRAPDAWGREAKASKAILVWDALDFWRQPSWNTWTEATLIRYAMQVRDALPATLVIGATQAMAADIGGVYIPHHSRLGLTPTPIRERMDVVAYDGAPRYLGPWRAALERTCTTMGLRFVVNPPDLGQADVVVAFRGAPHDGWVCRQWKSGVKYVNAIAAGRPVITQDCAAYREIAPSGLAIEQPSDLARALTLCAPADVRQAALEACQRRSGDYTLKAVARRYQTILGHAWRHGARR